ncbi:putative virion structural protein [Erwinia phage vB_EamM_Stratton]|uniref:Putative virion structural protein n=2 Tax=Erskinevirus EaH2 TaxID=2169883 RepID=A0A1B2IH62_9CAUD|nr:virion structural protein [Erwinia phage phiEaH2]AFQ96634.1 putative virion structural protein [Erwinia phage phiEaH2]ANZ50611.1 putative virion structural protein [Erwinia phage vB_EamM_Stratton]
MAAIVYQYPFDLKGTLTSNAVTRRVTLGSGKVNRAFAFPDGPFYAESFRLAATNKPGTFYKRGTDYELIFAHPAYEKLTKNQEILMGVVVTNSAIPTDITISAQVIGGPQSANVVAITQAIAELKLEDRTVDFKDLRNVPDTFPSAPTFKDVGDIYGFEFIITVLSGIKDAINSGSAVQLEQIKGIIDGLKQDFLDALNAHVNAQGNVHSLNIHQINGLTETEIRALIAAVQTQIDDTLKEIASLKTADTALGARIDAVVQSLVAWNDQLNTVAQNYQKMSLALANLNSLVLQLQKAVNDLQSALNALTQRVGDLESQGQDFQQKIDNLQAQITAQNTRITNNTNAISQANQNLANHVAADNPHPNYLHKTYGGVVQAAVHVNNSLTTRDDVQAEAGTR